MSIEEILPSPVTPEVMRKCSVWLLPPFTMSRWAVKSTVYRNIDKLCNEGRLVKHKEPNSKAMSYQYSEGHGSCNEHSHAQCSECGKLFHIDNEVFAEATAKMRDRYGINMDYRKTLIIGICNECQAKRNRIKHP